MSKLRKGDLVKIGGIFESENLVGIIVNGPYPAVFVVEDDGISFSEETLAVDLVCNGRHYPKVKYNFLEKIVAEQPHQDR